MSTGRKAMREILSVQDLNVHFSTSTGDVKVLNGISFQQTESQIYCIVGENGSGKTTLALAIMGLLPETAKIVSGSISFQGVDLLNATRAAMNSMRGRDISMVFQDARAALNPVLTIGKQLEEAIFAHNAMSKEKGRAYSLEILSELGLSNPKKILESYPFNLSGGMCQRVMLAVSLVNKPKLLIADEVTSALDVTLQADVLDRLKTLCKNFGTAILFISHDFGVVANMAHHVGVLYSGTLVESAPVVDLFSKPTHPYTSAMIEALPRLDDPDKKLTSLPGKSPTVNELSWECPFLTRCNKATIICRSQPRPLLSEIRPDHLVACYNPLSFVD